MEIQDLQNINTKESPPPPKYEPTGKRVMGRPLEKLSSKLRT